MKFPFNKLGVYLGILVLGGGAGFWGSSYFKQQPTVIERSPINPPAIPSWSSPRLDGENDRDINFIAAAVQKVGPAVVRIDASRQISSALPDTLKQPLFRRFFGNGTSVPDKVERGTGSLLSVPTVV